VLGEFLQVPRVAYFSIYSKLQQILLPLKYGRNKEPGTWADFMKGAIAKNAAYFNSHRMMRRYATEAYLRWRNLDQASRAASTSPTLCGRYRSFIPSQRASSIMRWLSARISPCTSRIPRARAYSRRFCMSIVPTPRFCHASATARARHLRDSGFWRSSLRDSAHEI
jgi:hypothetical protein